MSRRRDDIALRIGRGLIAGVIAGAIASFAMDRFQAAAGSLLPSSDDGEKPEPATQQVADAVARSTVGHEVPDDSKPAAGQAVHYATGIALGITYAVVAEFRPQVTAGYGTAFALGTATVLDEAAVPALGFGAPPWQSDAPTLLYSYASHLVFGGVTELVRRQVARVLG